jgi:MYXO-CTERM domain-containing protein
VRSLVSPVFVAPPIAYFAFGAIGLALAANRRRRRPAPGAVQD